MPCPSSRTSIETALTLAPSRSSTASSTTMPSTMIRPNREFMLMVPTMAQRITSAPAMEMGIPIPAQKERRVLRKHHNSKKTMLRPMMPAPTMTTS